MRLTLHYKSAAIGEGKINVTIEPAYSARERSKAAHDELRAKGLDRLVGIVQRIEIQRGFDNE